MQDLAGGRASTLVGATIVLLNVTVGLLFLARRPAIRTASVGACALCLASVPMSACALALAPPLEAWPLAESALFAVAGLGAVASLAALGASFGVLPAVRGVVGRGPFRVVRHPIYACELAMVTACVAASSHPLRWLPLLSAVLLVVVRIGIEERLLMAQAGYESYRNGVRWRLVPGLW